VTVVEDGTYTIDAYHYPREADRAMNKTKAIIQLGDLTEEVELKSTDKFSRFELELKKGNFDLRTNLIDNGKSSGALFVYIRKK